MIHTNRLECHWASLKRRYLGVYHHFSGKHLHRYSNEFAGRHNACQLDTEQRMTAMVQGGIRNRLWFADQVGPKPTFQSAMLNTWNAWE